MPCKPRHHLPSRVVASALRAILGGEHRYRKFVKQLAAPRGDGLLHFWQSAILDALEAKRGLVLPRRADELRALLPPLPEPPRLEASAVPAWVCIDEMGGSAPVQASGRAGSWRWYFRARHNTWSLGAILGNGGDPVDVSADSESTRRALVPKRATSPAPSTCCWRVSAACRTSAP
jgi:hypothetical protein